MTTSLLRAFHLPPTLLAVPLLALTGLVPADARAEPADDWDVTIPRGETREISFETDRGTWMSVDVSPDGTWLSFDLLGRIYRLPIGGGDAACLTCDAGLAIDRQPSISPDGASIAFVSDRSGQDDLWIMHADGANPRGVLEEATARVSEPTWMPDGEWIALVRTAWTGDGERETALRLVHRDGGTGLALVDEGRPSWPDPAPDGRSLAFHHRQTGGDDLFSGGVQIARIELDSGRRDAITSGVGARQDRGSSGGAFAPRLSPDGSTLAFARRLPDGSLVWRGHELGARTTLWLRDLRTGTERLLLDPIEVDHARTGKSSRALPGYDWHPDGGSLVLSRFGRLERVDAETGRTEEIPFRATVARSASEAARAENSIGDGPFLVRFPRWQTLSSTGVLAFEAVGRVWIQAPGEPAERITEGAGPLETSPAWSPDGRTLAYVTWGRPDEGHLRVVDIDTGMHRTLTAGAGEYLHPAWSPDGDELAVARGSGATWRGRGLTRNEWWDVGTVPATGGEMRVLDRVPGTHREERLQAVRPSWGPDGRLFFHETRDDDAHLFSVPAGGGPRREHLRVRYADELVVAGDRRQVAFQWANEVFTAPLPDVSESLGAPRIDPTKDRGGSLPVTRRTHEGGFSPRFRADGSLEIGDGDRHLLFAHGATEPEFRSIELEAQRPRPGGRMAFRGARVVTLASAGVLDDATVVVEDGRIACVGTCELDAGVNVLDATGTTIVPGFVDLHAHHHRENRGVLVPRDPEQAIMLAYGVTTVFDPYTWAWGVFAIAEATAAGEIVGPRVYSTGDPIEYGNGFRKEDADSLERIREIALRQKQWGAIGLKQYVLRTRPERQWVAQAARELGLLVTAEGSHLEGNVGMILDGHTAWEHSFSAVPLGPDATRFFGLAGAVYSPTFVVGGPRAWDEEYFYQREDVWKDPKLRRWLPWRASVPHTRTRTLRPEEDYAFPWVAEGLADIVAHGGLGVIGSHGQHHGIGAHWEIEMAASALGPLGALEVASLHAARYLGLEEEIGSVEAGKLADLLVLDRDPLEDIRNTRAIRWVVLEGLVRDAETLDEVWPEATPFGPRDWSQDEMHRSEPVEIDPFPVPSLARPGGTR